MAKLTQKDRLLAALKTAGPVGLHSFDGKWGELRLSNVSQRVAELEADGHRIDHKREKRGDSTGTRYTLIEHANAQPRPVPLLEPSTSTSAGGGIATASPSAQAADGGDPRADAPSPADFAPLFDAEDGAPRPSAYDAYRESEAA